MVEGSLQYLRRLFFQFDQLLLRCVDCQTSISLGMSLEASVPFPLALLHWTFLTQNPLHLKTLGADGELIEMCGQETSMGDQIVFV